MTFVRNECDRLFITSSVFLSNHLGHMTLLATTADISCVQTF